MAYNAFNVYRRELAPGTVSLTGDRAQGDDSKHWAYSTCWYHELYILYIFVSVAQLVASLPGEVLAGVVKVVGSSLIRGKIFTASIGSVDSLYLSVFIFCVNLHQFLIQ